MGTRIQRGMQLDQVRFALRALNILLEESLRSQGTYRRLESASRGLYEELEKLNRSGPDVPITERAMGEVNRVLEEAAQLMRADPYVALFIRPFDPRRGVPVHRDTVLALRQARQGLERYAPGLEARLEAIESRAAQARAIRAALEIAAPFNDGVVLRRDLEDNGVSGHPDWFLDFSCRLSAFDFAKLNGIDLLDYFLGDL